MEPIQCSKCGQEIHEWVEFCPNCAEPIESYARPAGFWIRVGAYIVDILVFLPLAGVNFWNSAALKSVPVMIATALPMFFYKPFMESFFGATLGKMACGIRVMDDKGAKLSLFRAYTRALPFLLGSALSLVASIVSLNRPEFEPPMTPEKMAELMPSIILGLVNLLVSLLILTDCVFAAFTLRKRALHDMLAESYVVYKKR